MKYEDPKPLTRVHAEELLRSQDPKEVCAALVAIVLYDPDWIYAQGVALRAAAHDSTEVRGLSATCFGHIARIHGRLDVKQVLPALKVLSSEPTLAGRVEDALDDIRRFLKDSELSL